MGKYKEPEYDEDIAEFFRDSIECAFSKNSDEILRILRFFGNVESLKISDRVRTAAIGRIAKNKYRIYLSPEYCEFLEPEDKLFILIHELGHAVSSDFSRNIPDGDNESKMVFNVALDIAIDRKIWSFFKNTRIFKKTKSGFLRGKFENLLLIPPGILELDEKEVLETIKKGIRNMDRKRVNREGIFRTTPRPRNIDVAAETFYDIYKKAWLSESSPESVYLDIKAFMDKYCGFAVETVCEIIGLGGKEPGYSDILEDEETEPKEVKIREVQEKVRKWMDFSTGEPIQVASLVNMHGVIFQPSRKEAFLMKGGYMPVFYPNLIYTKEEMFERAYIYVDVSGSTEEIWDFLYGLVMHVKDFVGKNIWVFSNRVERTTIDELSRGLIRTTGGTDYDCVAEHILSEGVRKAVVITDGYADISPANADGLRKAHVGIFLILTEDNFRCPLIEFSSEVLCIEDVVYEY